jgi:glyoxylase-like metal-dependent hydrolase (beta-lactamase superfamily II)
MDPRDAVGLGSGEQAAPLIERIPVGALEANCYLVTCPETRETVVIDPGAEAEHILARIRALGVPVAIIVHTHGHFDHISATEALQAGLPRAVPLAAHPADAYLYEPTARAMGSQFGYPLPGALALPDVELRDGGEVRVGTLRLRVVQTPGHTPGSVSLVCGDACVFSGDTLFRRGIGRTDLPGGDEDAIYESILTRLYTLPPGLAVYPGHGAATTIGEERSSNPFVQLPAVTGQP